MKDEMQESYFISADFFSYFDNVSPVMWKDPTILGVTALNENGVNSNQFYPCKDRRATYYLVHVFRRDIMSIGAWMITSDVWIRYDRKWCKYSMLQWIRKKEHRKGQACIIPQVNMIGGISSPRYRELFHSY